MLLPHPTAYQLGNPVQMYRANSSMWVNLLLGSVLVLLGLLGIMALVASRAPLNLNGPLFWYLLTIGIGVTLLIIWYRHRDLRVQVFDYGFVHTQAGTTRAFRWEELQTMWWNVRRHYVHGIHAHTTQVYTIEAINGERLKLTGAIARVDHLAKIIQHEMYQQLFPQAMALYNSGATLEFGPLSLSQAGISNGKELLPWQQMKEIRADNGTIVIRKHKTLFRWANVSGAKIPNLAVCLAIVKYATNLTPAT